MAVPPLPQRLQLFAVAPDFVGILGHRHDGEGDDAEQSAHHRAGEKGDPHHVNTPDRSMVVPKGRAATAPLGSPDHRKGWLPLPPTRTVMRKISASSSTITQTPFLI